MVGWAVDRFDAGLTGVRGARACVCQGDGEIVT